MFDQWSNSSVKCVISYLNYIIFRIEFSYAVSYVRILLYVNNREAFLLQFYYMKHLRLLSRYMGFCIDLNIGLSLLHSPIVFSLFSCSTQYEALSVKKKQSLTKNKINKQHIFIVLQHCIYVSLTEGLGQN